MNNITTILCDLVNLYLLSPQNAEEIKSFRGYGFHGSLSTGDYQELNRLAPDDFAVPKILVSKRNLVELAAYLDELKARTSLIFPSTSVSPETRTLLSNLGFIPSSIPKAAAFVLPLGRVNFSNRESGPVALIRRISHDEVLRHSRAMAEWYGFSSVRSVHIIFANTAPVGNLMNDMYMAFDPLTGLPLGYSRLCMSPCNKVGYCGGAAIASSARRKGIYLELIKARILGAQNAGMKSIGTFASQNGASGAYAKLGFQKIAEVDFFSR